MMYMPDAIHAILTLMEADASLLKHRNAFNVTAMSVDPELIAGSIRRQLTQFELNYEVDAVRQSIADGWPDSIDASAAAQEWGFCPNYNLDQMTDDMLTRLTAKMPYDSKII
ncbi:putative epimerase/dehydratase [compost metagenome]